jgi:hypothetical protein
MVFATYDDSMSSKEVLGGELMLVQNPAILSRGGTIAP